MGLTGGRDLFALATILLAALALDLRPRAARPGHTHESQHTLGRTGSTKSATHEHVVPTTIFATADSHGTPHVRWTWGECLRRSDLFIHCGDIADQGFQHEYGRWSTRT